MPWMDISFIYSVMGNNWLAALHSVLLPLFLPKAETVITPALTVRVAERYAQTACCGVSKRLDVE